jgi:glucosamine-6-phosphate deaminase
MNLHILDDERACAGRVVDVLVDAVARGATRIGLATGATFEPIYRELAKRGPRWDEIDLYLLDEYLGLDADDPRRFRNVLESLCCRPLGIPSHRLHGPLELASDPAVAAELYEERLRRDGGLDLQLLGLGANGHIGFNEPGSSFSSATRVVELSARTRSDNRRSFGDRDEVPTHAVTQGIRTILSARSLVLVAVGGHKARALARALEGEVGAESPASALRRHPDVRVVADRAAADLLVHAGRGRAV